MGTVPGRWYVRLGTLAGTDCRSYKDRVLERSEDGDVFQ